MGPEKQAVARKSPTIDKPLKALSEAPIDSILREVEDVAAAIVNQAYALDYAVSGCVSPNQDSGEPKAGITSQVLRIKSVLGAINLKLAEVQDKLGRG